MDEAYEHDARAARNQSLFRTVNEKVRALNVGFAQITNTYEVTCECADVACMKKITVPPATYEGVRANRRQFIVLPGHLDPGGEGVVLAHESYLVVEKSESRTAFAAVRPTLARSAGS